MDSKRLQVKKKLTALLEGITEAAGYQHDLTSKVWRGRNRISEESDPPCVVIVDIIPDGVQRADKTVQKNQWEVGIKGFARPDRIHPTDPAENLMADIKKCLSQALDDGGAGQPGPDFLLGGLVGDIIVDNGVVFPPDEGGEVAYCVVKLTFEFIENTKDPYYD